MLEKLSVALWSLNGLEGTTLDKLRVVAQIPGITGVEMIYPTHVNEENEEEIRQFCQAHGLTILSVNPFVWDEAHFKQGAFTAVEANTRRMALDLCKRACDMGRRLGAKQMCLFPGRDGFEFSFQHDYQALWEHETEGFRQLTAYDEDYKIAVEYNSGYPQRHLLLHDAASVLLLAKTLDAANLGITLDFFHSRMAGESPAEVAVRAAMDNRLFDVHINDDYGYAQDEIFFTGAHRVELLECLYSLRQVGYAGWISQEYNGGLADPVRSGSRCMALLHELNNKVEQMDPASMQEEQHAGKLAATQQRVAEVLFAGRT